MTAPTRSDVALTVVVASMIVEGYWVTLPLNSTALHRDYLLGEKKGLLIRNPFFI